ncbi:MAG: 3-isopropylmalate dehydratase small subunit, partial [Mailhella sp.]|nr:3-isopropylmalate dehydratase small subunit [Mailhella sp.]
AGVSAVIAASFGRIFYRNAINLGLLAIVCKDIHGHVKRGDRLSLDVATSTIVNESTGETFQAEPLSEYMMDIIRHGGIKPMMRAMAGKI